MTHSTATASPTAAMPVHHRSIPLPLLVVLVGLGVLILGFGTGLIGGLARGGLSPTESRTSSLPLAGVMQATVLLQFGAGELSIGALEPADSNLATATIAGPSRFLPEPTYQVRDGRGELSYLVRDQWSTLPLFWNGDNDHTRMSLGLTRNVPLAVTVEGGATEAQIDLSSTQVRQLELQMGAATTQVRLPEHAGQTSVTARGGMMDLTFDVPPDVAADILISDGLASRLIDEQRFRRVSDDHYRSVGYETAANRVDLHIELGLATLRIQ